MEFNIAFNASFFVALTMGLFSSLHCAGMCGSIIGSLTLSLQPEIRNNKYVLSSYVFNYNLGRICSYTIMGTFAGVAGTFLAFASTEEYGHRALQVLSSIFMAGAGLHIAGWFPSFIYIEKVGAKLWKQIEPFGCKLIPVSNRVQAYLFGMIWGWLPCSLVYAALAIAATSSNVWQSGMTMLAFGLGTLPSVMGMGIMTGVLTKLSRMQRFKKMTGLLLVFVAIIAAFPWLNPMRLQYI